MKGSEDKNADDEKNEAPSDFVVGLVTFIVFLIFMMVWMYYSK